MNLRDCVYDKLTQLQKNNSIIDASLFHKDIADYFNQTLKKIYGNQIPPNMIIDVQK